MVTAFVWFTQTASLLYRSGHKRAAKELLCEQRQIYAEFQRTPWPCSPRTEAELRRIDPALLSEEVHP